MYTNFDIIKKKLTTQTLANAPTHKRLLEIMMPMPGTGYAGTGYAGTGYAGTGYGATGYGSYGTTPGISELQMQQMWQSQVQTMQPAPPAAYSWTGDNSRRFNGRVKSFSGANGYGFLTGPDILSVFGADIFVHQLEVDKLTNQTKCQIPCGTAVSFTVVPNKKGQPQARELRYEQPVPQMAAATGASGNNATMAAIQAAMLNPHPGAGFQDYSSMPGTYSQGGPTMAYPTEGHHTGGVPKEAENSPMEKFKNFVASYGNDPYGQHSGRTAAGAHRDGERSDHRERGDEDPSGRARRRSRSPRQGPTSTIYPNARPPAEATAYAPPPGYGGGYYDNYGA